MIDITKIKEVKVFNEDEYIGSVYQDRNSDLKDGSPAAKSINEADLRLVYTFMKDRIRDNEATNTHFKSVKDRLSFTILEK